MEEELFDDELDKLLKKKRRSREYWLFVKYGLNPGEWEEILIRQGGVCAICKKRKKRFDTDHCHKTGKVRGILCHKCNVMLGHSRDSKELLLSAAEYLAKSEVSVEQTKPPVV